MKKIPTLFVRDPNDRAHVTREVNPACQWVLDGEGVATRKYDGTCVMFDGACWWARREVKPGKNPPPGWVEVDADAATGKRVGWEPIGQSPFAKFHAEAIAADNERTSAEAWAMADAADDLRRDAGDNVDQAMANTGLSQSSRRRGWTAEGRPWGAGTYELVGPKVQGNPERCVTHALIPHRMAVKLSNAPRDYDGLRAYMRTLAEQHIEGIVWHHPDGRMAKIKRRDFRAEDPR